MADRLQIMTEYARAHRRDADFNTAWLEDLDENVRRPFFFFFCLFCGRVRPRR